VARILAIDTATEYASVCLLGGDAIFSETILYSEDGHAHKLFGLIGEMAPSGLSGMDCFAAGAGPGSFTGVRVALSAVKGLAEALGRPAVAVSNLAAIAAYGTASLRAAVIDARRGEVYGGVYTAGGTLVGAEFVGPLTAWLATLPGGDFEFVTQDPGVLASVRLAAPVVIAPRGLAPAVARIAARQLAAGLAVDPSLLDANYVRRSDAELKWREPISIE